MAGDRTGGGESPRPQAVDLTARAFAEFWLRWLETAETDCPPLFAALRQLADTRGALSGADAAVSDLFAGAFTAWQRHSQDASPATPVFELLSRFAAMQASAFDELADASPGDEGHDALELAGKWCQIHERRLLQLLRDPAFGVCFADTVNGIIREQGQQSDDTGGEFHGDSRGGA